MPTLRQTIRVVQYGLGAIGIATARLVLSKTSSRLVGAIESVFPQLAEIARAGIPCISSAEELFHTAAKSRRLATELNKIAASKLVAVVGTGVNPGFVMDLLPAIFCASCQKPHELK